jgi:hypothetical protein
VPINWFSFISMIERPILVMDLSEARKQLGTRIDGFVGQYILPAGVFFRQD